MTESRERRCFFQSFGGAMRKQTLMLAAAVALLLASGTAMADFKSTCMTGSKNDPDAEKNCSCMASKIKPEDLSAATKAGEAMNAAEASGKSVAEIRRRKSHRESRSSSTPWRSAWPAELPRIV